MTKSFIVVCFHKSVRGNLLCESEKEKKSPTRNPVCIYTGPSGQKNLAMALVWLVLPGLPVFQPCYCESSSKSEYLDLFLVHPWIWRQTQLHSWCCLHNLPTSIRDPCWYVFRIHSSSISPCYKMWRPIEQYLMKWERLKKLSLENLSKWVKSISVKPNQLKIENIKEELILQFWK